MAPEQDSAIILGVDGPETLRGRRIARSFDCVGCAYDLQGLDAMGACPECGTSIRRSILGSIDPTVHSLPEIRKPGSVAWGLRLFTWSMAISFLCLLVGSVLQHQSIEWNDLLRMQPETWPRSVHAMVTIGNVLHFIGLAVAMTAVIGVVCMLPLTESQASTRSLRMLARLFFGCLLWMATLLLLFDRLPGAAFGVLAREALESRVAPSVLVEQLVLTLSPLVGGGIVLFGVRSFFGELGRRSREFRTATTKRQKVVDVLIASAIWCLGVVLQLIGAINKQPTLVTLGTVVRFIAGLLVVIGIAYLVMNLLWIARSLAAPPPRLTTLLTPAAGDGGSG